MSIDRGFILASFEKLEKEFLRFVDFIYNEFIEQFIILKHLKSEI